MLETIILNIFQNKRTLNSYGLEEYSIYSYLNLNDSQINQLTYPPNFKPLGIYILEQVMTNIVTSQSIISFVMKEGYIYGIYFGITNQQSFCIEDLTNSKNSVCLDTECKIIRDETYLEVYNNVNCIIVVTSFCSNPLHTTFGYPYQGKYYYEVLSLEGIQNLDESVIHLTGISKNLTNINYCRSD